MINDDAVIQWLRTIAAGSLPLYADNVGLASHALEMLSPQAASEGPALEGDDITTA